MLSISESPATRPAPLAFDADRAEQSWLRAVYLQLCEETHAAARAGRVDEAIAFFDRSVAVFLRIKRHAGLPVFHVEQVRP